MGTFHPSDLQAEVIRYATRGILLDTNVLLVCVVGRMDPERIEKFKNTRSSFSKRDYFLIEDLLKNFTRIVVTPHILTEASNFAGQLNDPVKGQCFDSFARDIEVFQEEAHAAKDICVSPLFRRLGIADAGIALIARGKFLVLTADLVLYNALLNSGVDTINYNHIRPIIK